MLRRGAHRACATARAAGAPSEPGNDVISMFSLLVTTAVAMLLVCCRGPEEHALTRCACARGSWEGAGSWAGDDRGLPGDRDFMIAGRRAFYIVQEALVQHVGTRSSLGGTFWMARSFLDAHYRRPAPKRADADAAGEALAAAGRGADAW